MTRALKLLIVPSLLGFVVAAALGLLLAELWQTTVVGVDNLQGQVYDRAMEDRVYHDRIMGEVSRATDTILLFVAIVGWLAATGWFLVCWKTPIVEVGKVRRLRSSWGWTCLFGLLAGLVIASYVAFMSSRLVALITPRPLLGLFLFLVLFFAAIYYAASVLCTHPVYVGAVPRSKWRTW